MENLLTPILTNKGREVAARKALRPAGEVRAAALEAVSLQPRRPFAATLAASPTGIIAEFKRKSPSLGWIRPEARVEDVVTAYERAGATALSVLADETYFGGCLGFIRRAGLRRRCRCSARNLSSTTTRFSKQPKPGPTPYCSLPPASLRTPAAT